MTTSRPKFDARPCMTTAGDSCEALQFNDGSSCIPICFCRANFPLELFQVAVSQLIEHPEYNSTLILRSEILSDTQLAHNIQYGAPQIRGHLVLRSIHRKLLPRRPGRDPPIEQCCTFFCPSECVGDGDLPSADCVVLAPIIRQGETMPYYHPAVTHLIFRYHLRRSSESSEADDSAYPQIRIEVVPLPNASDPRDVNSRLYRTCLALLETIHRYGWGAMTNYKKRVIHDSVIPRDRYQDFYLVMRERYKHLVNEWQEATDPLKHVFEDIGIATFLMLLWKDMFGSSSKEVDASTVEMTSRPRSEWPRPPGGFLDLGCGNGLLTHILVSEGYEGEGIDVRARMSWASYPSTTQIHLHVHSLDPTSPVALNAPSTFSSAQYFKPGVFIIANHADEMTPWTPVLSTIASASGYLSIPCCAWSFDTKFERSASQALSLPFSAVAGQYSQEFIDSLNLGGDGSNTSTYAMYRIWLANLSLHCGWEIECETLRIPSTRNWALIGRRHIQDNQESMKQALDIVAKVRERGIFKPRRPEGKAGDH